MKTPQQILQEFQLKIKDLKNSQEYVKAIVDFTMLYGDNYSKDLFPLIDRGIEVARSINDQVGETLCLCSSIFVVRVTNVEIPKKYDVSLEELTQRVNQIKYDPEGYSLGLNMLSYFHWFKGDFERAFSLAFEALKNQSQSPSSTVTWNYFGIAVFYFDTKDFENSKLYFQKSLENFRTFNEEYGIARSLNGLGTIAIHEGDLTRGQVLLNEAQQIYANLGHYAGLSRVYNDLGLAEKLKKNYNEAVSLLSKSIQLRKEIEHKHGLTTSHTELGETYMLMNSFSKALEQLQEGLNLAQEINSKQKEMRLHKSLYDVYKKMDNTNLALSHFEKYFEIKAEILSDEAANNIKKVQTRYEKEKSEKETELERIKNVELKRANAIIEQKNKDITDSINYARRIQLGILPSKEILDTCFKNYFVFYKPKDIVSGDFYWANQLYSKSIKRNLSVIAAVDCTGHGVPGAFMSMLANTLLNQTLNHKSITNAADILNFLNLKLPENLKSSGGELNIRDGMDMSLCIIDEETMNMQFAGANNNCWVIRNGQLLELKADKQAISASNDISKKPFINQVFELQKNDTIYLFTDGFPDQFGGPLGKKYTYKRFKELLLEINKRDLQQQLEILSKNYEQWKGSLEQIDDVCVIGVSI